MSNLLSISTSYDVCFRISLERRHVRIHMSTFSCSARIRAPPGMRLLKIKQRQIAAWRLSNEGYFSLIILKLQCNRARWTIASYPRPFLAGKCGECVSNHRCFSRTCARINAGT